MGHIIGRPPLTRKYYFVARPGYVACANRDRSPHWFGVQFACNERDIDTLLALETEWIGLYKSLSNNL